MGTKFEQFVEESTKITSSSEIDEILKQARAAPALDDDDDVGDFEERTQIGNVKELVARSMTIEDPTPPAPFVGRASTNVIRRAPTPLPVRPSEQMPIVRAQGSLSDITAPSDDAAFDPWDEQPVASASQPMATLREPETEVTPLPLPAPMAMPMPMPMEVAPVTIAPPIAAPMITPPAIVAKTRWGAIAWVCLLALMLGVGTVGYLKIRQLEGELAQAKAALEQR